MTDTKQPIDKRILGDQRIFQAVVNDLKMKHELVELADGTHRWVYTYDGIDPYEMEDPEFPSTVQLIHQYGDTRELETRLSELRELTQWKVSDTGDPDYDILYARHKRSYDDRVAWLEAELKKTKEEL